jgi:hypothetical protein
MAFLITLLLAMHLVAVNVAAAAPPVCTWLAARGRRGDQEADQVGRRLAWLSLAALLVGMLLGGGLVAIAWWDRSSGYWQAANRFAAREYWFAAAEMVFSLTCLWIYATMWQRWRQRPWLHGLLAVMSATNLLYHFPPLMIVLGELAARPQIAGEETITHTVFRNLMLRPEVLTQTAHFALAAVAFGGWALLCVANNCRVKKNEKSLEREESEQGYDSLISAGAWIALAASLAQLAIGLLVLIEFPIARRGSLLGNDWLSAALFFVAVLAAFALLHMLATVALGDTGLVAVRRCSWLMLVVVLLMTGTLVRVRQAGPGDARIRPRLSADAPKELNSTSQPAARLTASAAELRRPPRPTWAVPS